MLYRMGIYDRFIIGVGVPRAKGTATIAIIRFGKRVRFN